MYYPTSKLPVNRNMVDLFKLFVTEHECGTLFEKQTNNKKFKDLVKCNQQKVLLCFSEFECSLSLNKVS